MWRGYDEETPAAQRGFQFRVALEALKEQKTLSQLASEYAGHPTQITQWKKQVLDGGSSLFGQKAPPRINRPKPPAKRALNRLAGSRWNWSGL